MIDLATVCDARHGNERCRKPARHDPADPWHESARFTWRVKAIDPPTSFAPQTGLAEEMLTETRAALSEAVRERNEARIVAREVAAYAVAHGYGLPLRADSEQQRRILAVMEKW